MVLLLNDARMARRFSLLLILPLLLLGLASCDSSSPEPESRQPVTAAEETAPGPSPEPTPAEATEAILANGATEAAETPTPRERPRLDLDLPEPPRGRYDRVTILYTGLTEANLEVCGCPKKQLGGIAPRAAVVQETREQAGEILLLDAGRFMAEGEILEQRRSRVYLESMEHMGYDAVALSSKDFAQGYAFLEEMAQKVTFPFLSCNLEREDGEEGFWKPYTMAEVEGHPIAIIGFTDPVGFIEAGDVVLSATDPAASLADTIAEVSPQADLIVVLGNSTVQTGGSEFFSVPRVVDGIDFLIGAIMPQPERDINDTVVLPSEYEGMRIGRLDVNLFDNGETFHRWTYIELPKGMEREETVREMLNEFYQGIMEEEEFASQVKDLYAGLEMEEALEAGTDNAYTGVDSCADCHPSEHRQWRTTSHASAFFTLLRDKKYYVPECISCHVTGYNLPTGFGRTEENNLLRDVQCEVCHGPGQKHVELEKAVEAGEAEPVEGRYIRKTVNKEFCVNCHDQENSPQFQDQFSNFWDNILHRSERLRMP